jgi:hypothetical protein
MTRRRIVRATLGFTIITLIVLVLAPVVLVAGELVNRRYLRGPRIPPVLKGGLASPIRRWPSAAVRGQDIEYADPGWVFAWEACRRRRFGSLAEPFLANPVWIALTAPARWLLDRIRPRAGHGRRRGNGNGPPPAGVREPRRPRPDQPAGAIALPEPF